MMVSEHAPVVRSAHSALALPYLLQNTRVPWHDACAVFSVALLRTYPLLRA